MAQTQSEPVAYAIYGVGRGVGSKPDPTALGGYGKSDNRPQPLGKEFPADGRVRLVLRRESDRLVLNVVNGSTAEVTFAASDSTLPMTYQARAGNGPFRQISYLMHATCGNSYHNVFLPGRHRWELPSPPLAKGPAMMSVRAKLKWNDLDLVSNEVEMPLRTTMFLLPPTMKDYKLGPDGYAAFGRVIDPTN